MGSTLFRDPQTLSSTLAALGMLQPLAFESLNRVDSSDSVSNYYIVHVCTCTCMCTSWYHSVLFTCILFVRDYSTWLYIICTCTCNISVLPSVYTWGILAEYVFITAFFGCRNWVGPKALMWLHAWLNSHSSNTPYRRLGHNKWNMIKVGKTSH